MLIIVIDADARTKGASARISASAKGECDGSASVTFHDSRTGRSVWKISTSTSIRYGMSGGAICASGTRPISPKIDGSRPCRSHRPAKTLIATANVGTSRSAAK